MNVIKNEKGTFVELPRENITFYGNTEEEKKANELIFDLSLENDGLQQELERYKNIIDEAIDCLRDIRQSTFTKYNSNEWNNCLSFNDDIKPLLDKLEELKGSDE